MASPLDDPVNGGRRVGLVVRDSAPEVVTGEWPGSLLSTHVSRRP